MSTRIFRDSLHSGSRACDRRRGLVLSLCRTRLDLVGLLCDHRRGRRPVPRSSARRFVVIEILALGLGHDLLPSFRQRRRRRAIHNFDRPKLHDVGSRDFSLSERRQRPSDIGRLVGHRRGRRLYERKRCQIMSNPRMNRVRVRVRVRGLPPALVPFVRLIVGGEELREI